VQHSKSADGSLCISKAHAFRSQSTKRSESDPTHGVIGCAFELRCAFIFQLFTPLRKNDN
jgi:hypothetical protein